jgi:putative addiction module component (TIGR02574 family)
MNSLFPDELARLTAPERIALIAQLWDSLDNNEQLPLTAAQKTELDRRLETIDQDRQQCISWIDLKTELERRCS